MHQAATAIVLAVDRLVHAFLCNCSNCWWLPRTLMQMLLLFTVTVQANKQESPFDEQSNSDKRCCSITQAEPSQKWAYHQEPLQGYWPSVPGTAFGLGSLQHWWGMLHIGPEALHWWTGSCDPCSHSPFGFFGVTARPHASQVLDWILSQHEQAGLTSSREAGKQWQ